MKKQNFYGMIGIACLILSIISVLETKTDVAIPYMVAAFVCAQILFTERKDIYIDDLENERLKWSMEVFTEATPQSSLEKLKEEIKEIEANIAIGNKDPEEYADATMCLWDSAGRDGITIYQIFKAFGHKLNVNKGRKWKKNPDNSYSHIK